MKNKEQKDTRIAARISEVEKKKLDEYAVKNDLSLSQVIRKAIKEFLNKQ